MRNQILAVAALALLSAGCSSENEPVVTEAPQPSGDAAAMTNEAEQDLDQTQPGTEDSASAAVEAVEESSGVVLEEVTEDEHDLRLAAAGGTKKEVQKSRFAEGVHYREILPAQPTVSGTDKIEVVEVFWYGCGHCFAFDPYIKRWEADLPADVEFVRLPAVWNDTLKRHARAFYTAKVLAKSGALSKPGEFHDALFQEIHVNRKPLNSERSIQSFFERFGVPAEEYAKVANSFEVDQQLRSAMDLTRRYGVTGVPMIVVNGRYASLSDDMKGYDDYIALIDDLVAKER